MHEVTLAYQPQQLEMTLAQQPHQPEVALAHQHEVTPVLGVTLVPQVPPVSWIPLAPE